MPAAIRSRDLVIGLPVALIGGLLVGTIGTFKHQVGVSAETREGVPIGLVLSLAMVAVFLLAVRVAAPRRWFALAAGVGATAAAQLLAGHGPGGGSTVILPGTLGEVWRIGVPVIALVVVVWPRPRRRARAGGILEGPPDEKDD